MSSGQYRFFPPFRLDPANAQLWRGDREISLRRKTFDVLLYLVDHPAQLVTKQALLDAVWPEVTVSDSMPSVCVKELRKALGDRAKVPRFIETVHGRGYRFIAKVTNDAPAEATRRASPAPQGPKSILVGREHELVQMQSWYSRALEGQRRVVFVAGEAGIGKTAFVQAFLESISLKSVVRVGRGQCVEQYGTGEPYMPVLEALGSLGQEPGGQRVVEILNRFAPTWLAQMPALLTPEERSRLSGQNQMVTQQRMLREMTQALEAMAAETPLVMSLEDLHWSDFSTLELISAIARRNEPTRLMIVGTYRPVEVLAHDHPLRRMKQELELHFYCEELRLKALNRKDIEDYLARRLGGDGSRKFSTLAPIVHARTDGNPLFMVNLVEYLLADSGLLVRSREVSEGELAEKLRAHRLDALRSVRQMIERNLERLQPEEQMVLEGASAVGAEFSAAAVAAALERPQDEVEACFARLSRHEQFVNAQGPVAWPDGTIAAGFRFHHALYQEVLYERLPAGHQVQLHRRIAAREEVGYGERADEIATELAHHYSCANDKTKAIEYFRLAGERAVVRGAVVEAEDHYRRAIKLLIELPQAVERDQQELTLQIALGSALWSSRSWAHPEASRAFARAEQLAEELGESSQLMAVLGGLTLSALGGGKFKLARELGERLLVTAKHSGDRASLRTAHTMLGQALIWRAQYADAGRHLELGTAYYDETESGERALERIDAPALAAIVALVTGFPDRARKLMNDATDRAARHVDAPRIGIIHVWGGMLCALLGDGQACLEHAQALQRLAVKQPAFTGFADFFAGEALMIQGQWEEGARYLRRAIAFHEAVGLYGMRLWQKLDEIELLASQGRIADALALVREAIADAEEHEHLRSPALRLRADLLAKSDAGASTIDTAYRAALECARSQAARFYELQAATHYARWLKSHRRADEAEKLLGEVYAWFTEGFDTLTLREARALLDELRDRTNPTRRPEKS